MPTVTAIPTSGVGSWPGSDIDDAVRKVFDLVSIPYLPELPGRGRGSDLVGRALGLLDDLAFEVGPRGWRVVDRTSLDQRRARARLRDDLDVLAERAHGYDGVVKIAVCGWWTLAAVVELPRGGRLLSDAGAVRDLVESARGAALELLAEVRRRLPGADVRVQLDEPSLPAVLAGGIPTQSGLSRINPVEPELVTRSLVGLPARTVVHCCAAAVPVRLLRSAGITDVSLDGDLVTATGWDAVAEHVDAGGTLWLGVPAAHEGEVFTADQVVTRLLGWLRPLELGPSLVDRLVLTHSCGLAGLPERVAVRAVEVLDRAAHLLAVELMR